jgi:mono/diheme cytochrome c family protein
MKTAPDRHRRYSRTITTRAFRSNWVLIASGVLLLALTDARAENYERGQQLYENHCQACHASLLHSPVKGKVKSFRELENRVSSWSIHAAKDWSAEEVRDVSYYLDRTFYHFGVRDE